MNLNLQTIQAYSFSIIQNYLPSSLTPKQQIIAVLASAAFAALSIVFLVCRSCDFTKKNQDDNGVEWQTKVEEKMDKILAAVLELKSKKTVENALPTTSVQNIKEEITKNPSKQDLISSLNSQNGLGFSVKLRSKEERDAIEKQKQINGKKK